MPSEQGKVNAGENTMMDMITVHIPRESLHGLDELVRTKRYASRSEAVRVAIRDLLKTELWDKPEVRVTIAN